MILHIDMDAFYASVEQLDNPELRGKCVIVGGSSHRGVVTAASYEARRFGVHSAMPMFQAKKQCPNAAFLPVRMHRYKELSRRIMSILRDVTPLVEPISIDEAYLDITGCESLYGSPVEIARMIKTRIKDTVHLPCSIGVAPNKFIAKIASDMSKPDGLLMIGQEDVASFIESLPIRKVPGVGDSTQKKLDTMGIKTLGDVKKYTEESLLKRLGKFGLRLSALSAGMDPSPVIPLPEHKSISSEETLVADTVDKALLNAYLLRQAEDVAKQLRRLEVMAKTITLKVKHADFSQVTRSTTLSSPTCSSKTVYYHAQRLLADYPLKKKVRLVGVGASGLIAEGVPVQLGLFDENKEQGDKWERVDRVIDSIAVKFGASAIKRAALKDPE